MVLAIVAFVLGGITGLIVLFARISATPWIRSLAKAWISVFQGTPLLMQLFIIFFGLANRRRRGSRRGSRRRSA